jgi:glycosyltransferase involved in cell wall biosynthesis
MTGRPLHILFFSESPVYGGAEEYVYQVIRALGNGRFTFTFLHEESSALGDFPARLEKAGARIEKVRKIQGKWDVGGFLRHVRRFRRLSPDIVHFNQSNPYTQQYSVVAARCAGVRNLVAIYHLTPRQATGTLRGKCFERLVMRLLSRVLVSSGQNREEMCGGFPGADGKVEVMQNGIEDPGPHPASEVDQLKRELGIPEGKCVISAAGRLTPQKGFSILLDAAALLRRDDIALVIAGEGPERDELEERARQVDLRGRVTFAGFQRDVGKLFWASDLVAIPSFYEGQPFVLLEAMAAGKAVVASDVYGMREAVVDGETGMLIPPGSPIELARALAVLIDDPGLSCEMGRRARRRYEEYYTARNFRENMGRFYLNIAGGKK